MESSSESETKSNNNFNPKSIKEGKKRDATSPNKDPEQEERDVIRSKNPEVQDIIRWKVKGSKKHYYDGFQPTQSRSMKRPIAEEYQIITTDLHEYSNLKMKFNEYELEYLNKPFVSYYRTIIQELLTNYLAISEMITQKGQR